MAVGYFTAARRTRTCHRGTPISQHVARARLAPRKERDGFQLRRGPASERRLAPRLPPEQPHAPYPSGRRTGTCFHLPPRAGKRWRMPPWAVQGHASKCICSASACKSDTFPKGAVETAKPQHETKPHLDCRRYSPKLFNPHLDPEK